MAAAAAAGLMPGTDAAVAPATRATRSCPASVRSQSRSSAVDRIIDSTGSWRR